MHTFQAPDGAIYQRGEFVGTEDAQRIAKAEHEYEEKENNGFILRFLFVAVIVVLMLWWLFG